MQNKIPQHRHLKKQQKHKLDLYQIKRDRLAFGNYGLKALDPYFLNYKHIDILNKLVSKYLKSNQKRNQIWLRTYNHKHFTEKSKGSRMGKGKGKIKAWYCEIKKGQILLEWSEFSLKKKSMEALLKELNYKLPINIALISIVDTF